MPRSPPPTSITPIFATFISPLYADNYNTPPTTAHRTICGKCIDFSRRGAYSNFYRLSVCKRRVHHAAQQISRTDCRKNSFCRRASLCPEGLRQNYLAGHYRHYRTVQGCRVPPFQIKRGDCRQGGRPPRCARRRRAGAHPGRCRLDRPAKAANRVCGVTAAGQTAAASAYAAAPLR